MLIDNGKSVYNCTAFVNINDRRVHQVTPDGFTLKNQVALTQEAAHENAHYRVAWHSIPDCARGHDLGGPRSHSARTASTWGRVSWQRGRRRFTRTSSASSWSTMSAMGHGGTRTHSWPTDRARSRALKSKEDGNRIRLSALRIQRAWAADTVITSAIRRARSDDVVRRVVRGEPAAIGTRLATAFRAPRCKQDAASRRSNRSAVLSLPWRSLLHARGGVP